MSDKEKQKADAMVNKALWENFFKDRYPDLNMYVNIDNPSDFIIA